MISTDASTHSSQFHLTQVNTAILRAPLDDPSMADFVAQIRQINAIADADPWLCLAASE